MEDLDVEDRDPWRENQILALAGLHRATGSFCLRSLLAARGQGAKGMSIRDV